MKMLSLLMFLSIGFGVLFATTASDKPIGLHGNVVSLDRVADTFVPQKIGHPSFMSPHGVPILVQGEHVFVVNTPADTVDVIDRKTRQVTHRIPVGIDPVSIAARPDGKEIWVSNHVSDSVSVIDTVLDSPTCFHLLATIQDFDQETRSTRFDEPVGIAFANNQKAYIALSSENQVAVVDVAKRTITKRIKIKSQDPRQLVVDGERLFVIPFESNNKTQLSGGSKDDIDGDLVTFDAWDHSVANNNVLSIGHVIDVIKHPEVPDRDLFVFDTSTDKLITTVDTLGTLLYGMTVDENGRIIIAQTDARNDINGRAGTKDHGLKELRNRAFLNRLTTVELSQSQGNEGNKKRLDSKVNFFDLEPLPPQQPELDEGLATPYAVEMSHDNETIFVTAAGSDKLVSLDSTTGEILGRVNVGAVPRGIAIDTQVEGKPLAWVFNAVDNTVSIVDVADSDHLVVKETIQMKDPTSPKIKRGRKAFNTANASTTGTFSCASCHPDGHTDQLLWVLKTPIVTGGEQIMPRSTMPVRGLRETAPFHWDGIPGDPYGGINSASIHSSVKPNTSDDSPKNAARHLIDGALASTMMLVGSEDENDEGKSGLLSGEERDDLATFLLSIPYPPAQRRSYTNELTEQARSGFELFHIKGDDDPARKNHNVCGDCHRMPNWVSTNTPGTGMDAPTWRGAYDRWLILPQGRLNIVEFDFFKSVAENGLDEEQIWRFSWAGRERFNPVWDMVLEGSTGYSGAFGRQVTLNQKSAEDKPAMELLKTLEAAATEGAVVVQVAGVLPKEDRAVVLQFESNSETGSRYHEITNAQKSDTNYAMSYSRDELVGLAKSGSFVGTFTAHAGAHSGNEQLQPVLWTEGSLEKQSGHQKFPFVFPSKKHMKVSGRHIDAQANVFINGHLSDCELSVSEEIVEIRVGKLPPVGIHMLQVQNPGGLFSNDFIFHVAEDQNHAERIQQQIDNDRTDRQTRLIAAVSKGNLKEVRSLLQNGAKVNALSEDSRTALSAAALNGHFEIAKLLIDRGATVSRPNRDGNTPLHAAAFFCRHEIVELLLENGASVTKQNNRKESSLDVVTTNWSGDLARFYQMVADVSGFTIDLEQIKRDRKEMEEILRERLGQAD